MVSRNFSDCIEGQSSLLNSTFYFLSKLILCFTEELKSTKAVKLDTYNDAILFIFVQQNFNVYSSVIWNGRRNPLRGARS